MKLKKLVLSLLLAAGCCSVPEFQNFDNKSIERRIDNCTYEKTADFLKQKNRDEDKNFRFGLVSDCHGNRENAELMAKKFLAEKVNAVVIAGDLAWFQRFNADPYKRDDKKDIENSLIPFLETNLPVFAIPGNHEKRKDYFETCRKLEENYPNLFYDVVSADLDDANFIFLPGGDQFINTQICGFYLNSSLKTRVIEKSKKKFDSDLVFLISHVPQRFETRNGLDNCCSYVAADDFQYKDKKFKKGKNIGKFNRHFGESLFLQGCPIKKTFCENEGNKQLREQIDKNEIRFSCHGHFHNSRNAVNSEEEVVEENIFSSSLHINPGALLYGYGAIVEVDGSKARYRFIDVAK